MRAALGHTATKTYTAAAALMQASLSARSPRPSREGFLGHLGQPLHIITMLKASPRRGAKPNRGVSNLRNAFFRNLPVIVFGGLALLGLAVWLFQATGGMTSGLRSFRRGDRFVRQRAPDDTFATIFHLEVRRRVAVLLRGCCGGGC